ncbi:hypothetical protein [Pseudomonas sp. NMS19W]|uniref:hypothetical protein n=1 Tax=Pseudomonas sp. NMS19W TaxID=3079768 RepID=UPI003F65A882
MTADIHDIAEQRPHLTVAADGGVHVIPCDLVRSVIAGDKPSTMLTEPVLRRIIEEWFESSNGAVGVPHVDAAPVGYDAAF